MHGETVKCIVVIPIKLEFSASVGFIHKKLHKRNTVDVNIQGHQNKYDINVQDHQKIYNRCKYTGSSKEIQSM